MSNRVHLQSNDWLVFVDGVQIPWQSINYSTAMDRPANGSVVVEPDAVMASIRPNAVIALFCRDRYSDKQYDNDEDRILNEYTYYGGGEVTGVTEQRLPHSRGMVLHFESDLAILDKHIAFTSGLGGMFAQPFIFGNNLINPSDIAGPGLPYDLLSAQLLAQAFDKTTEDESRRIGRSLGNPSDDFGMRTLRMLGWLAAHNGAVRMQFVRTRLMNKFAAIDDSTLVSQALSKLSVPMLRQQLAMNTSANSSLLDMVRSLQSCVGYHFTTVPMPSFPLPVDQPKKNTLVFSPVAENVEQQLKDHHRIAMSWFRNDYLFLPDLFYSAPPPCNFMFPDMVGSRQTVRMFSSEPTRSVVVDPTIIGGYNLVFVEAPALSVDINKLVTPVVFNANLQQLFGKSAAVVKDYPNSPWASPTVGESTANTGSGSQNVLSFVSDDEFERGIVLQTRQLDSEYMLALARTLDIKLPDGRLNPEALSEIQSQLEDKKDKVKDGPYLLYVAAWLKYQHQLYRFARPTTVELKGHRWIVPGFSGVIFDSGVSYLTYVTGVSHSVDANGQEQTIVSIDRTRPINAIPAPIVAKVRATANNVEALKNKADIEIKSSFNNDTFFFESLYKQLAQVGTELINIGTYDSSKLKLIDDKINEFTRIREIILSRAGVFADVSVGSSRNEAGSLTKINNPDLATSLLTYLTAPTPMDWVSFLESSTKAKQVIDEALAQARKAVSDISAFNDAQVQQLLAGKSAYAESSSVISAINESKSLIAESNDELIAILSQLESEADLPIPPDYYNQDFIKLSSLDKAYQDLLGCAPLYTGPYAAGLSNQSSRNKAEAALEYDKLVTVLSRIFPTIGSSLIGTTLIRSATNVPASWDDIHGSSNDGPSTMEWQHKSFLKRKVQTLAEYLTTHGFNAKLDLFISDEPAPTVFYKMTPKTPSYSASSVVYGGKSFSWDDSVVSRIVDEGRSDTQDPLVEKRRASVKNPALTSAFRQEQIITYSRRHFGNRGFSGT